MPSAASPRVRPGASCYMARIHVRHSVKTFAARTSGELQRRFLAWRDLEKLTRADIGTDFPVHWEGVLHGYLTYEGEWRPVNGPTVAPVAPFQP